MTESDKTVQAGLRTRLIRKRRGMTLDALARRAELSKGHLSRFERGEKSLSLASLLRLAEAFDVSMGVLLGEEPDEDQVRIVRHGTGRILRVGSAEEPSLRALSGSKSDARSYTAFTIDLPGGMHRVSEAYHSGLELIYMLEGEVEVTLPDRRIRLISGDFIEFPGHLRHVLTTGPEDARLLLMILPQF